ncbi:hypothetical protein Tco_0015662 [Tanacetum coccineum]
MPWNLEVLKGHGENELRDTRSPKDSKARGVGDYVISCIQGSDAEFAKAMSFDILRRQEEVWIDCRSCKVRVVRMAVSFSIYVSDGYSTRDPCSGFGVSLVPRKSESGPTDTSPEYYSELLKEKYDFKPIFDVDDDYTCTFKIPSILVGVRTYLLGGAIDGSEANGIIRDPKLELESSRFTFDLVPLSYESVDVVVTEKTVTKRIEKDIASCGSKYLAYSEEEVEYQGSSGLLLQPELPE